MAGKSDYLETGILDHIFGINGYTWSAPTGVFVALFTSDPTDAGGGSEVASGGYTRVGVTNNETGWVRFGSTVENIATIDFGVNEGSAGGYGTVTSFGLFDTQTNGNLMFWNTLTTAKAVGSGDSVQFSSGQLTFTED